MRPQSGFIVRIIFAEYKVATKNSVSAVESEQEEDVEWNFFRIARPPVAQNNTTPSFVCHYFAVCNYFQVDICIQAASLALLTHRNIYSIVLVAHSLHRPQVRGWLLTFHATDFYGHKLHACICNSVPDALQLSILLFRG